MRAEGIILLFCYDTRGIKLEENICYIRSMPHTRARAHAVHVLVCHTLHYDYRS